jgi:hypothetical protein
MASAPNLTLVQNTGTRARLEVWSCIGCGHRWGTSAPPDYCRKCGVRGGYAPEDLELIGTQSADLSDLEPGVIVTDWAHLLPIGLPLGLTMVMRGRPGGGKSRSAFRFASQIGIAAVFGLEMGKVLSKETAGFAGANLDNCWWYDDVEGIADLNVLCPAVVVVDSIQKVQRGRTRFVNGLRKWAKDNARNAIFVSQLGIHGASRHGEDQDFDCDIVVDVSPGMVDGVACKNRHGINEKPADCREGCAHVRIVKSRVCQLVGGDVPIVAGF